MIPLRTKLENSKSVAVRMAFGLAPIIAKSSLASSTGICDEIWHLLSNEGSFVDNNRNPAEKILDDLGELIYRQSLKKSISLIHSLMYLWSGLHDKDDLRLLEIDDIEVLVSVLKPIKMRKLRSHIQTLVDSRSAAQSSDEIQPQKETV